MMAKNRLNILSYIIAAIICLIILREYNSFIEFFKSPNLGYLFHVFISSLAILILNSLILRELIGVFEIRLSVLECIRISTYSSIGNLVLPFRGGASFKAFFLKERLELPYKSFLSIFFFTAVLNLLVVGVLGVVGIVLFTVKTGYVNVTLYLVFLAPLVGSLFTFKISPSRFSFTRKIFSGWDLIRKHKAKKKIFFLIFIKFIFGCLGLYYSFRSVNIDTGFFQVVIASVANFYSALLNLTPSGLGVQELAIGYMTEITGGLIQEGLAVSIVFRVGQVASILFAYIALSFKPRRI